MFMHMYYTVSIIQYIYIYVYTYIISTSISTSTSICVQYSMYAISLHTYIHKQYYIVVSYVCTYVCTYAMLCEFILSVFAPASQGYATYVHSSVAHQIYSELVLVLHTCNSV